jgi:hypothetical protein
MGWYDCKLRRVRDLSCGDTRVYLELEVRRLDCRGCGKVKREQLEFLANNPLYTKRFAYYVRRRCRGASIKQLAAELKLDLHAVKALGSTTYPKTIGIGRSPRAPPSPDRTEIRPEQFRAGSFFWPRLIPPASHAPRRSRLSATRPFGARTTARVGLPLAKRPKRRKAAVPRADMAYEE